MSADPGPARALLFVADLTSRAEFLAAFAPYATATSILVVTHRSELPETGDRLVFRLALADGQTMLAGEATVTSRRGAGRRGVVRLEPRRLDTHSRATYAELVARARPGREGDRMDEAMERLAECHVLEEAQATGEIDAAPAAPPRAITAPGVLAEEAPARRRRRRAALAVLAAAIALLVCLLVLVALRVALGD